eukprot:3819238-Amphidinium_carterae.1
MTQNHVFRGVSARMYPQNRRERPTMVCPLDSLTFLYVTFLAHGRIFEDTTAAGGAKTGTSTRRPVSGSHAHSPTETF